MDSKKDYYKILKQIYKSYESNPKYLPPYAIELASLTGMRVGEISVLQWGDVDFRNNLIMVRRSDKYNRISKEWSVVETTKTLTDRVIPMDSKIQDVLLRLRDVCPSNTWLFPNKETWTHSNIISSCLKNKCLQAGLSRTYGVHAFRKTLNSDMRGEGASALLCSGILGNSVEVNNEYYTFDNTLLATKRNYLEKAHAKRNISVHQCPPNNSCFFRENNV